MSENISVVLKSLPFLLEGIPVTLGLVLEALFLGLVIGLALAIGQMYGNKYLARLIAIYVWFFRGLPTLVLLFLFYFGFFPFLGLDISAFSIAVIALGMRSSAYQSQILRGAIQSLGEGQMLAARSLGMSKATAVTSIIIPQAMRIALPGWSNEYPVLLTDSAVTYAIGVMEILTRGSLLVSSTYKPMPLYLTCAVIFILLNYAGMQLLHMIEKRTRIKGFAGGGR